MLGVLLSGLVLLIISAVIPAFANDKPNTYGSKLEEYIVSHHPKDGSDVERLTREFDQKQSRGFL